MVMLFVLLLLCTSLHAKDLGVQGHLFEIQEEDLLQYIQRRLQTLGDEGTLEAHTKRIQQKAAESVRRPKPGILLPRASRNRTYTHDPSIVVPYDLKDHQGRVFHKKGTRVNPLKTVSLRQNLVFINGEDEAQVTWFLKTQKWKQVKLILVSGSPIQLMDIHRKPVYFDQGGRLVNKFKIKAVPAIVTQRGLLLHIQEVAL